MTDLNEQSLLEAMKGLPWRSEDDLRTGVPQIESLQVTWSGICFQARRYLDGDLTVQQMKDANIPAALIFLVLETAEDIKDYDPPSRSVDNTSK